MEDQPIRINVNVRNEGPLPVEQSVLLFFRDDYSSVTSPVKSLLAFQKIRLDVGETKDVSFEIPFESLALLNKDMVRTVEKGEFTFMIEDLKTSAKY